MVVRPPRIHAASSVRGNPALSGSMTTDDKNTRFERASGRSDSPRISQRVIATVADETDTDPTELEPLYHAIDPDCLDALFQPSSQTSDPTAPPRVRLVFRYADRQVRVAADGSIDLFPAETEQSDLLQPDVQSSDDE